MAEALVVEEFLRLENASAQLLAELESLKKETVSFGTAHTTVAAAAAKLGALSGNLSDITTKIGESAQALREIGTPELLARQTKLEDQLAASSKSLADQQVKLGEQFSAEARALAGQQTKLENQLRTLVGAFAEQQTRLGLLSSEISESKTEALTASSRTNKLVRLFGSVILLAAAVQIIMALTRR